MTEYFYVPISIENQRDCLPKRAWEILPGLWFQKTPQKLKSLLKESARYDWFFDEYDANYGIRVNAEKYQKNLAKRILKNCRRHPNQKGEEFAKELLNDNEIKPYYKDKNEMPKYMTPDPEDLTKLVLVSFTFQEIIPFVVGNIYTFSKSNTKYSGGHRYTNAQPIEKLTHLYSRHGSPRLDDEKFNRKELIKTVELLERYYRPYYYYTDRLAFALKYLWNGMVSKYPDQVFLNTMIVLECLFSTGSPELTKKLSRRTAMMLHKTTDKIENKFQIIKDLYRLRSDIVHGRGEGIKGPITINSYHISPKRSQIPIEQFKLLKNNVLTVLKKVMNDKKYLSIIQKLQSDDETKKNIINYFKNKS